MSTKVEFIDSTKVRVETSIGDTYILGYSDTMNYQIEQQWDGYYTKTVAELFDKFYDGNSKSIWGAIFRGMFHARLSSFIWAMPDKNKERIRIGNRIKELRKEQGIDAKELALRIGIDAGNLCRIEQGKFSVGFDTLNKIANTLGMSIDFVPVKK